MSDNVRNIEEYRADVLDKLDQTYEIADLRNFERWRKKVLEGLAAIYEAGHYEPKIREAVEGWLDDHPEATTTVADGSITKAKLYADLIAEIEGKADEQDLNDLKSDLEGSKADAIVETASGSIASFDDGGDGMPLKSLVVNIEPKQEGTGDPSPSNIRPISGTDEVTIVRDGKNLFNTDEVVALRGWSKDGDELKGPINSLYNRYAINGVISPIKAKPNTQYVLRYKGRNETAEGQALFGLGLKYSDGTFENGGYITSTTYTEKTIVSNPSKVVIGVWVGYALDGNIRIADIQLEEGTTPTAYEPYQGESYEITLPQTVYGGTLDVVSGKLILTEKYTRLLSSWSWNIFTFDSNKVQFYTSVLPLTDIDTSRTHEIMHCNLLKGIDISDRDLTGNNNSYYFGSSGFCVRKDDITTVSDFKVWLDNNEVYGTYACTPTEIQLTPTEVKSLLGDNNIWADAGTVDVEYRADTTLAFEKLKNAVISLGGNI